MALSGEYEYPTWCSRIAFAARINYPAFAICFVDHKLLRIPKKKLAYYLKAYKPTSFRHSDSKQEKPHNDMLIFFLFSFSPPATLPSLSITASRNLSLVPNVNLICSGRSLRFDMLILSGAGWRTAC